MSASRSDQRSAAALGRFRAAIAGAVGVLARGWRDGVYVQERLLEMQRPWEHEGPLRWRRELGGHRLDGVHLPTADGLDEESIPVPVRSDD